MSSVSIGPLVLMTSTALLLASILLFWSLVSFFTRSTTYQKTASDTLTLCLAIGFLVARVTFVISMWEIYQKDWISIFDIRDGGFNEYLGWLAGVLVLIINARIHPKLVAAYFKPALITGVVIFPLFVLSILMNQQVALENIEVMDAKGESHSVSLQTGKPLVLNFWASWCPPCRREMPILELAQQKYDDLEIIFVNHGEAPTKANQFLKSNGLELQNLYFDFWGKSAKQFGSMGLPTTLFFNSEGLLVDRHIGELSEASLQYYLQPLLDEDNSL